MSPKVRKNISSMSPYKPPLEGRSSGNKLLLDFNERTTPIGKNVLDIMQSFFEENRVHVYPEYGNVCEKIASHVGIAPESVMITNGSDQGIDVIIRTFCSDGDEIIVPIPTFAMFPHCAEIQGCKLITPHYTKEGGYPLDEVLSSVTDNTKIIVVCNPNSPTGTLLSLEGVEKLASSAPNAVIYIDECYYEFSNVTAKDMIAKYPNIVITRTFSKTWGLSSLRIGYVLAAPQYIDEFLKVRGPYDVNTLSVIAVNAALDNKEYMESYVREVIEVSKPMLISYFEKEGIEYWPTESNFILFKPDNAVKLEQHLRENRILVRPRRGPNIDGTLRITFGTKDQMERVINVFNTYFEG